MFRVADQFSQGMQKGNYAGNKNSGCNKNGNENGGINSLRVVFLRRKIKQCRFHSVQHHDVDERDVGVKLRVDSEVGRVGELVGDEGNQQVIEQPCRDGGYSVDGGLPRQFFKGVQMLLGPIRPGLG